MKRKIEEKLIKKGVVEKGKFGVEGAKIVVGRANLSLDSGYTTLSSNSYFCVN